MGDARPVVVIGAGAAGLMAAIAAGGGARPVILLESTGRPGQKILISGGGRCNVLPSHADPADFVTDGSPHTLARIFRGRPLEQVRTFFESELGVPLRLEPETGKLFPAANKARTVLDALLSAAHQRGVTIRLNACVVGLANGDPWHVRLATGETFAAARVILATGGLSVPATGSDGAGLRMAAALGHTIVPTYPALVPLTCGRPAHHALAGLSLPVALTSPLADGKRVFTSRGGFLFTHRGYSGPAVLNIAHLAVRSTFTGGPRPPIWAQWSEVDTAGWNERLAAARGPLMPLLREDLPERLAALLLAEAGLAGSEGTGGQPVQASQLRREDRQRLAGLLGHYPLPWTGHEGYRVAEVTGGGVSLAEVNPVTLESRLQPGLHLCGEILDAFGPIGGYNFLWAWITGWLAGRACRGY
jgi:predicted Rossmann fold flavoprotein